MRLLLHAELRAEHEVEEIHGVLKREETNVVQRLAPLERIAEELERYVIAKNSIEQIPETSLEAFRETVARVLCAGAAAHGMFPVRGGAMRDVSGS